MKTFKQFMEKLTPVGEILPDVVNQIGKAGDARSPRFRAVGSGAGS